MSKITESWGLRDSVVQEEAEVTVESILAALRWRQALRGRQDAMRARTRAAERARLAIGLVRS